MVELYRSILEVSLGCPRQRCWALQNRPQVLPWLLSPALLTFTEPLRISRLVYLTCVVEFHGTTVQFPSVLHQRRGVLQHHPGYLTQLGFLSDAVQFIRTTIGLSRDVIFTALSSKEPPWICRLFVLLHDFVEFCRHFVFLVCGCLHQRCCVPVS